MAISDTKLISLPAGTTFAEADLYRAVGVSATGGAVLYSGGRALVPEGGRREPRSGVMISSSRRAFRSRIDRPGNRHTNHSAAQSRSGNPHPHTEPDEVSE